MGQRHNRKRTRSRPRNRDDATATHRPSGLRPTTTAAHSPSPSPFAHYTPMSSLPRSPPATYWDQQYAAWQSRIQQQSAREQEREREQEQAREQGVAKQKQRSADAQRRRVFGGEEGEGDGESEALCAPMLQVVLDLFGGVDYLDP
ncbi:hypothetical protein LTR16_003423 [Cryomyces antarcticus]|uniref:Uncharacterized protein n=1 Tax=Cryomyces antarcticus TaxID=329879 RepID=A0ABR0LXW9_9PEZI|nr:hypothetical protein LTR16_003423 [Cryomyces antarcticus]